MIKMKNYQIEIDQVQREEWSCFLKRFRDSNIIQTWDFAGAVCPGQKVNRVVLRRQEEVVALAQVRIVTLPFFKYGVAHIEWGPIWRRKGETQDPHIFAAMLTALREEYAVRRKLLLRIVPNIADDIGVKPENILFETGFKRVYNDKDYRTIIKDISFSLPDIRKSLEKNWRYSLRRAEGNQLEIRQGSSVRYYEELLPVYRELIQRKGFIPIIDIERWIRLQEILPDAEKPHIFMVYYEKTAVAGLVVSSLGETGFPIISATTSLGKKLCASYLMFWHAFQWLKENGCRYYDLAGIDPEKNPGTYHFKKGFRGNEVSFIGRFEYCSNPLSRMLVRVGDPARDLVRKYIRQKNLSNKK
jgi:hypothetical protein